MMTVVTGFISLVVALMLARRPRAHRRYSVHVLAIMVVLLVIAVARALSSRALSQCGLDLTARDTRPSAEVGR